MSQPSSTFSPSLRCPSVGSATTSGLSRDEAKHLYERNQQRWSQTNEQLNSAILTRTTSPLSPVDLRHNDMIISSLRRQLAEIQAEMAQNKQQLQFAEATILQQQATIRNQSKAIENPRCVREMPQTPQHHSNKYGQYGPYQGHGHAGPPPLFGYIEQSSQNGLREALRSVHGAVPPHHHNLAFTSFNSNNGPVFSSNSTGHTPHSTSRHGAQRVNDYGSPEPYTSAPPGSPVPVSEVGNQKASFQYNWQTVKEPLQSMQPPPRPGSSATGSYQFQCLTPFASPESFVSNPYPETSLPPSSTSLVLSSAARSEATIRESFQRVFDIAQQYANTHANFPSTAGDSTLPKDIKDRLLNAATNSWAFRLMVDRDTRYLLVSKIMIQWIVKHILKYNTFSGLDTNIDQIINGAKATIYQSTPAQLRFLVLTNIANEVKKLQDNPDFAAYVEHLSQQRAKQLFAIIHPMMHQQTIGDYQNMVALMRESFTLAQMLFTRTDEFSFDFPQYGLWYDASEMINIDPQMGGYNANQLKNMQASVRLGATPLIKFRRNMPNADSEEQVLLSAKVLLERR